MKIAIATILRCATSKTLSPREWQALQVLLGYLGRRVTLVVEDPDEQPIEQALTILRDRIDRDHHRSQLKRLQARVIANGVQ